MPRPALLAILLPAAAAAVALGALVVPAHPESLISSSSPESYIADLFRATVETAVAAGPEQAGSEQYTANAMKALITREVPLGQTARFVLGRYSHSTDNTPAAAEFQEQFLAFLAEAVTRVVRRQPGLSLAVAGSQDRADGTTLVRSELSLASGAHLSLDWILERRPESDGFQVVDLVLDGIDARIILRTTAASMLADGRATVADLTAHLRHAFVQEPMPEAGGASATTGLRSTGTAAEP